MKLDEGFLEMAPSSSFCGGSSPTPVPIPPKVAEVSKDVIRNFPHTKRVGSYLLGKTLGEGSFAKVKEGLHTISGEKVAVKVIDKKKAREDAYVRKNLRREGKLLQMVRHKHVVQLYEIMETENSYYLVTELCEGGDLMDHICAKKKLDEKETKRYIRQIISAVDYLHKTGILHRDLKVENLLLDENGDIKIIDFGLSNAVRVHHTKDGETQMQEFCVTQCGSPAYAAPELLGNKKYGQKVDIWSIGVNMYAMLTGNLPFTVEPFNIKALHNKMLNGDMNAIPDHLSRHCKDFLKKLLTPNPDERISLQEATQHPWLSDGKHKPVELSPFPNKLCADDLDTNLIHHMVNNLDFRMSDIIRLTTNNIPNSATATYHLMYRKLCRYNADNRIKGRVAAQSTATMSNKSSIIGQNRLPTKGNMPMRYSSPIKDNDKYLNRESTLPATETLNKGVSPRRASDGGHLQHDKRLFRRQTRNGRLAHRVSDISKQVKQERNNIIDTDKNDSNQKLDDTTVLDLPFYKTVSVPHENTSTSLNEHKTYQAKQSSGLPIISHRTHKEKSVFVADDSDLSSTVRDSKEISFTSANTKKSISDKPFSFCRTKQRTITTHAGISHQKTINTSLASSNDGLNSTCSSNGASHKRQNLDPSVDNKGSVSDPATLKEKHAAVTSPRRDYSIDNTHDVKSPRKYPLENSHYERYARDSRDTNKTLPSVQGLDRKTQRTRNYTNGVYQSFNKARTFHNTPLTPRNAAMISPTRGNGYLKVTGEKANVLSDKYTGLIRNSVDTGNIGSPGSPNSGTTTTVTMAIVSENKKETKAHSDKVFLPSIQNNNTDTDNE